jgi:selenoprotein W-related protein
LFQFENVIMNHERYHRFFGTMNLLLLRSALLLSVGIVVIGRNGINPSIGIWTEAWVGVYTGGRIVSHRYRLRQQKRRTAHVAYFSDSQADESSGDAVAFNLDDHKKYQITIEYCPGCRWNLRAFWMAQELLSTFAATEALECVTLLPSTESGCFRVQCYHSSSSSGGGGAIVENGVVQQPDCQNETPKQLWDRSIQSGFPEIKELKQLVRDEIDPRRYLGHSDSELRREQTNVAAAFTAVMSDDVTSTNSSSIAVLLPKNMTVRGAVSPHVSIMYCVQCNWLLRAAYYAQELMSTFDQEIKSISLIPSRPPNPGGHFTVHLHTTDTILWDRSKEGRFPETKELKQLVRDQINPMKGLGHSDVKKMITNSVADISDSSDDDDDGIDENEAEQARAYFGVA